ncbi:MAG: 16S rRNA (cytidine(1402)-2'-O)-methyltransferase [Clostridiales bacterium]
MKKLIEGNGVLYVVATPIGNLEDITIRAIEILKNIDIIAAEDTRHTLKLLNHYLIKKPIFSYHEHNKYKVDNKFINLLKEGKKIALVTDAGTPGISDPGEDIIKKAIDNGIAVVPLPGPTALITALVISGLKTDKFIFEGFLPTKKSERKKIFEDLSKERRTIIIYESPHSLRNTLNDILKFLGNRKISISREITKLHEEVIRAEIEYVIDNIEKFKIKGEFVIVIEGSKIKKDENIKFNILRIEDHYEEYIKLGYDKKIALKKVADDRNVSRKEIYNIIFKK